MQVMVDCCMERVGLKMMMMNNMDLELEQIHQMLIFVADLVVGFFVSMQQGLVSYRGIGHNPMLQILRLNQ